MNTAHMSEAPRPRQGKRVVNPVEKGERGLTLQRLIEESLSARRSAEVQTFTPVPHPSPRGVSNFLAADLAPAQDVSGQVLFRRHAAGVAPPCWQNCAVAAGLPAKKIGNENS